MTAARARAALRTLRAEHEARPSGGSAFRRWHRRYVILICEYLLSHLSERELPAWQDAFSALHAMVASAWGGRPSGVPRADAERIAWSRLSVSAHLDLARHGSLLSSRFDHGRFVPHYQGFVRFLAERAILTPLDAVRLLGDYGRERRLPRAA